MRALLRLVIVAVGLAVPATAATPASALPPIRHVFVIVLENKDAANTFGEKSKAPYLSKELTAGGQLITNYYGVTHFSLGNYIAMISGQGSNPLTQADCQVYTDMLPGLVRADGQALGVGCVYPKPVKTIADQLQTAGRTWHGYMEDMNTPCRHPAIGSPDSTQSAKVGDQYAARHNPFVYFHSIIDTPSCFANDVDLEELSRDLSAESLTPSFSLITPNLCHDGHDEPCVNHEAGGLSSADDFLRTWVPRITSSPAFDNGLLVVNFDESEDGAEACCAQPQFPNTPSNGGLSQGPGGGKTGAVVISPFVDPGSKNQTPYNHFSLLRSVEDVFGLPHLGYAGQAGLKAFGDDVYSRTPPIDLKVTPKRLRRGRRSTLRVSTDPPASVAFTGSCGRAAGQTDTNGHLRLRVRPRSIRACRIRVSRDGYRSSSAKLLVRR